MEYDGVEGSMRRQSGAPHEGVARRGRYLHRAFARERLATDVLRPRPPQLTHARRQHLRT
jgi:hypothetical protein